MRNQETRTGNQPNYRRANPEGETGERWEGIERQGGSQGFEGRGSMGRSSDYERRAVGSEQFDPSYRGDAWQTDRWSQDERFGQQGFGPGRGDYERGTYGGEHGGFTGRSQYGQSVNTDRDRWLAGEGRGVRQFEGSPQFGGRQQHEGQPYWGRQQSEGPQYGGRQQFEGPQYGGRQYEGPQYGGRQFEGGRQFGGRQFGGAGRFERGGWGSDRFDQGYQGEDRFGMGGEGPSFDSMPQYGGWQQQHGQGRFGAGQGRGPKGYKRSDERIREDVSERLSQHYDLDASDITVNVSNGEVTLQGTVPARHMKHIAEMLVESVSGVTDVTNYVRVRCADWSASDTGERGTTGSQASGQTSSSQTSQSSKPTSRAS